MSTLAQPSPTLPSAAGSLVPYRVMVVDDSVVIRGLLTKILEKGGDITVVASAANGEQAIKALGRYDIEVIVLDIEMPVMGGMTALPLLLEQDPKLQIIIASTLSLKNAEVSLRALSSGAADYIPKPTATSDVGASGDFGRELLEKVRGLGNRRRSKQVAPKAVAGIKFVVKKEKDGGLYGNAPIVLRKPSLDMPQVVAIGSSTGGPQALFTVLENLGKFGLPIFITQHMPPTFTAILAAHINRISEIPCAEAVDGERVEAGKAYMAPGGFHMVVEKSGGGGSAFAFYKRRLKTFVDQLSIRCCEALRRCMAAACLPLFSRAWGAMVLKVARRLSLLVASWSPRTKQQVSFGGCRGRLRRQAYAAPSCLWLRFRPISMNWHLEEPDDSKKLQVSL